ncbi:DUF4262 domain-containing protein [Nonomuraea polychroma]|uniref:DUF4262 domain-containing protein n=1 Tax=Nonomuraea polychroma TaxID=46176 RepID=UPI003D94581E
MDGLIRRYGWMIQVNDDGEYIAWYHTIGLSLRGHPELVLAASADPDSAMSALNGIARLACNGADITDAGIIAADFGHERELLKVKQPVHPSWHATPLLRVAAAYLGRIPDAAQVVLADTEGRFPWDTGHSLGLHQPALWEPWPGSGWPERSDHPPRT